MIAGGERERLTLYAVCHRNNSDTLGIIKHSTFFQMDHLNLLNVVIMRYMTIKQKPALEVRQPNKFPKVRSQSQGRFLEKFKAWLQGIGSIF